MRRTAIWRSLYFQVLVAIALGIALGVLWPELAQKLKPLGDGFIKLIRLLIAPLIFCTVVSGIAGMARLRDVGKAGGLALLYFEVLSTIALVIGLVVVNLVRPGWVSTRTRRRWIPTPSASTSPRRRCRASPSSSSTSSRRPSSAPSPAARCCRCCSSRCCSGSRCMRWAAAENPLYGLVEQLRPRAVRHRRLHHAPRAARGPGRDGFHRGQVRHAIAAGDGAADGLLLPDLHPVRALRARRDCAVARLLDPGLRALYPR